MYGRLARHEGTDDVERLGRDPATRGVGGPPPTCHPRPRNGSRHGIGITHVAMRASWPGMEQADILASLELIGTEVLPEIRRRIDAGE